MRKLRLLVVGPQSQEVAAAPQIQDSLFPSSSCPSRALPSYLAFNLIQSATGKSVNFFAKKKVGCSLGSTTWAKSSNFLFEPPL